MASFMLDMTRVVQKLAHMVKMHENGNYLCVTLLLVPLVKLCLNWMTCNYPLITHKVPCAICYSPSVII